MTHLDAETIVKSLATHDYKQVAMRILQLHYNRELTNETYQGETSAWLVILANEVDYFPYDAKYRICVNVVSYRIEIDPLTVKRLEPTPVMEKLPAMKISKRGQPPKL